MKITNQKIEISKIIKNINVEGLEISKYHRKPKTFAKLPAITYFQTKDSVKSFFNKENEEKVSFQVDIWANNGSELSKVVKATKEIFLLNNYYIINGYDFDDPSGIDRYILEIDRR